MSSRERNLLLLLALGGFFLLNFFGFNYASKVSETIKKEKSAAELELIEARNYSARRDELQPQMEWLAAHMPEPSVYQTKQSDLQQFTESEANKVGLTIRPNSQKLLPTNTEGKHFHRVKVQLDLIGTNKALFDWFAAVNDPLAFRAATKIRLSPDREDNTKINCTVEVEQWFVPSTDDGM